MDNRFTYTNFGIDNEFILFEPIFEVILFISLLLLIIVMVKKVSVWICLLFACLTVIISGQLLWFSGIIVDELNLGGNAKDFYFFVCTVFIQCTAILITFMKSSRNEKIPQRSVGN